MKPQPTSIWIADLELGESLTPTGVSRPRRPGDDAARVLVRLHRQVLGFVSLGLTTRELEPAEMMGAIEAQLGPALARHLERDAISPSELQDPTQVQSCADRPPPGPGELISVVVCTRDRPEILRTCLERLQKLHFASFEVVVVDNAPRTSETRECFSGLVGDDARFRYVVEPDAGLSRARNRGLQEAAGNRVAFTDDDVQVDPWWLDAIAAGFARDPRAGCVTGLVPAAELEHPTQHYFDRRYSWSRAMEPHVYDLTNGRAQSALYPYSAGVFGTGANFAVDRDLLVGLGGFDVALGAGSLARGGEDLDVFVRVLLADRTLVYEPSAVVWHVHRAGDAALRRQLFSYGVGLTAFLTKYATQRHTRRDILRRVPEGARRIPQLWSPAEIAGAAPPALVASEVLGMLAGPQAYLRARRQRDLTPSA